MGNREKIGKFKRFFWYLDKEKLDQERDRHLIIHQTLAYGGWDDILRLIDLYGKDCVRAEFLKPKPGLYHPAVLNLVKFILSVPKADDYKYVKNIYAAPFRNTGSA